MPSDDRTLDRIAQQLEQLSPELRAALAQRYRRDDFGALVDGWHRQKSLLAEGLNDCRPVKLLLRSGRDETDSSGVARVHLEPCPGDTRPWLRRPPFVATAEGDEPVILTVKVETTAQPPPSASTWLHPDGTPREETEVLTDIVAVVQSWTPAGKPSPRCRFSWIATMDGAAVFFPEAGEFL